jgi:hypothetical protein
VAPGFYLFWLNHPEEDFDVVKNVVHDLLLRNPAKKFLRA